MILERFIEPKGCNPIATQLHLEPGLERTWCGLSAHLPKASELVPGSLLPRSNSMGFFARDHSVNHSSLKERRFATLYRQSSNTSRMLQLLRYYAVIGSRTCLRCEISKKLISTVSLPAQNKPIFLYPGYSATANFIFLRDAPTCSCIQLHI